MKSIPKDKKSPHETLNNSIRGQTFQLTNANEREVDFIPETDPMRNASSFLFNTKASLDTSEGAQSTVFELSSITPFKSTVHHTETNVKAPCLETVFHFQKPSFKKSSKAAQLSPSVESKNLKQLDNIKYVSHQRKVLGKITAKSPLKISKDASPASSDIRLTQATHILDDYDVLDSDEVTSRAAPNQHANILVANEESLQVSHSTLDESLRPSVNIKHKQRAEDASSITYGISRNACDPNESSGVTALINTVATDDDVAWAIPRMSHVHYVDFIKRIETVQDKSILQESMHATRSPRSRITRDSHRYSVHRISNPKFAPKPPSFSERISESRECCPEREETTYNGGSLTMESEKLSEAQEFRRSNRQRQKPRRSLDMECQRKRKSIPQSKVEDLEYPELEQTCMIVELPHDVQPGDTMLVEWPKTKNRKQGIGIQENDAANVPLLFLCQIPETVPPGRKNKKRLLRVMAPGCYEQSEPKRQRLKQSNSSRCLENDFLQSPHRVNWTSFKKSSSRVGGKYQVPSLPAVTMQSNFVCDSEETSRSDG
jgi:hypothetical protein